MYGTVARMTKYGKILRYQGVIMRMLTINIAGTHPVIMDRSYDSKHLLWLETKPDKYAVNFFDLVFRVSKLDPLLSKKLLSSAPRIWSS